LWLRSKFNERKYFPILGFTLTYIQVNVSCALNQLHLSSIISFAGKNVNIIKNKCLYLLLGCLSFVLRLICTVPERFMVWYSFTIQREHRVHPRSRCIPEDEGGAQYRMWKYMEKNLLGREDPRNAFWIHTKICNTNIECDILKLSILFWVIAIFLQVRHKKSIILSRFAPNLKSFTECVIYVFGVKGIFKTIA